MRATGSIAPAQIGGYRRPLLAGHEELLRQLTAARPGITLAELQATMAERGAYFILTLTLLAVAVNVVVESQREPAPVEAEEAQAGTSSTR